jgi:hypothetical protein
VLTLLWLLRRRWHGADENVLAQTVLKTLAASLVMALGIVVINSLWTSMGLHNRGVVFTVVQIIVETGVGAGIFLAVATFLKMGELRSLISLVLRQRKLVETPA